MSGVIIGSAFLLSLSFTDISNALVYGGGTGGLGIIVYYAWKKGYLNSFQKRIDNAASGLFKNKKDLEQLWSDLQVWESKDPRNTELIWDPATTSVKVSSPNPSEDFTFVSIVTRYKIEGVEQLGFRIHIVIESESGFIVQHSPTIYKRELYDNPFNNVPIVQDLKRSVVSGDDVMNRLRSANYGRLNGGGYTAFDSSSQLQQNLEEQEVEN